MNAAPRDLIRSTRFRREREAGWRKLETIVRRAERGGLAALDFDSALELAELYRQAVTSLSVAREISLDRSLLDYLESLCCRAYLAVYAPQETLRGLVWRFFAAGAPQAIRRSGLALALALLGLALGVVVAFELFRTDPTWYNTFLSEDIAGGRGIASTRDQLLAVLNRDANASGGALGGFATYLFSHNTTIALGAFSLGVAACLPSLLLVFYNGLTIGALFALYADRGIGLDLFAWLSVHGTTELPAVVIATAGGFRLGLAVVFPCQSTRRTALRREGHDAVKLAVLAAIMLVVAAVLEGFIRQLVTDTGARLAIGWSVAALWLAYFAFAGRNRTSE
jgi:uncharacterized membrane protein SpoIIM required for sporulation